MPFITQGKTNWKYILIVVILAVIIGCGIFWFVGWMTKEKAKISEIEVSEINLITTKLATIPKKYKDKIVYPIIFSSDGRRVAYVVLTKEPAIAGGPREEVIVLNEKESKPYNEVRALFFSPNGRRFAYTAEKRGLLFTEGWFLNLDGKEMGPYDEISYTSDNFTFSPDSNHFACKVLKDRKYFIILDEEEKGPYDYVGELIFSPDSNHFAYEAEKEGKRFVILNGKEIGPYSWVYDLTFNLDSKHFAYVARKDEKDFVVLDGKEIGPYSKAWKPTFSPDSERFAYEAQKEAKKNFIILDGREIGPYESINNFVFSPDSKSFMYIAEKEGKWFMVLDGKEKGPYIRAEFFTFSPDSKKFAYRWANEKEYFINIDGEEKGPYSYILDPPVGNFVFSPDSNRFAYTLKKEGKYFIILDGVEKGPYDYDGVLNLTFSPDSKHFAYAAMAKLGEKWLVVLDEEEKKYDMVYLPSFSFDSESRYLYYGAKLGNEFWWMVEEVE